MLAMRWSKSPQCMPRSLAVKMLKPLRLVKGCSGTGADGRELRFWLVEVMDFPPVVPPPEAVTVTVAVPLRVTPLEV